MRRVFSALREAWWTFRLHLLGWEVEGYALRVWPGYGRCSGNVTRWQPTYPSNPPRDCEHGWGLSSQGESWSARWGTPIDAVLSDSEPRRVIERRHAKNQGKG